MKTNKHDTLLLSGITFLIILTLIASTIQAIAASQADRKLRSALAQNKTLVQFRININYHLDQGTARRNLKNLRRILALFDSVGIKASFWFTGLATDQILRLDSRFVEKIMECGHSVGHHGANRKPHPMPMERVKGIDWQKDVQAILEYETSALNPITGELDPSRSGGLKFMQEVFKGRIHATGRFANGPILYVAKQFGCLGFVGLRDHLEASSNLGWFMGMMGIPDHRVIPPRMIRRVVERDGVDAVVRLAKRIDGEYPQCFAIVVHDLDFLHGSTSDQERFWVMYESLVRQIAADPSIHNVTYDDLFTIIADDRVKTIKKPDLVRTAYALADRSGVLPSYFTLGNDFLSLADAFSAFTEALAFYEKKKKFPESIESSEFLGPTQHGAEGDWMSESTSREIGVMAMEVLQTASKLNLKTNKELPSNIRVGEWNLNTAEFLTAMARAIITVDESGPAGLSTYIRLTPVPILPQSARATRLVDPLTRLQFWTYKPARWNSMVVSTTSQIVSPTEKSTNNTMHVCVVIHNEEDHPTTPRYGFSNNPSNVKKAIDLYMKIGRLFAEYGAKINLGSDYSFIEGVMKNKGTFFREWEQMGHENDVHSHQTRYSYLEVKEMLKRAGASPTAVNSGVLERQMEDRFERLEALWPEFEIIWGAATLLHQQPKENTNYVWRPSKSGSWFKHDPHGKIIYIGGNASPLSIETLRNSLKRSLPWRLNVYTIYIGTDEIMDSDEERLFGRIRRFLEDVGELQKTDNIEWMSLTEIAALFKKRERDGSLDFSDIQPDTIPRQDTRHQPSERMNAFSPADFNRDGHVDELEKRIWKKQSFRKQSS